MEIRIPSSFPPRVLVLIKLYDTRVINRGDRWTFAYRFYEERWETINQPFHNFPRLTTLRQFLKQPTLYVPRVPMLRLYTAVVYCHALFSSSLFFSFLLFFFFYISLLRCLNIPSRKLCLEKGRKRKEGKNCTHRGIERGCVEEMRGINFCIYCVASIDYWIRRIRDLAQFREFHSFELSKRITFNRYFSF